MNRRTFIPTLIILLTRFAGGGWKSLGQQDL